jgi:hypothetical protein
MEIAFTGLVVKRGNNDSSHEKVPQASMDELDRRRLSEV